MSIYSGYKYKRPRKRIRVSLFAIVVVLISIAITIFTVNVLAGSGGGGKSASARIQLSGLEFNATGTRGLSNKNKAMELAIEMRNNGGAGFVDFDGEWFVIQEIGAGDLKFSANAVEVSLTDIAHKETFQSIIQSFAENSETLSAITEKPGREVAAQANSLYRQLSAKVTELDSFTPSNAMYSEVLIAANTQLLALFLLTTEKSENPVPAAVKHSICWINFTYLNLLTTLQSL